MKKYITILSFAFSFSALVAQKQWTLRECIDFATEYNIDIKQQDLKVKQAEVDLSTSKKSRLPDLNGSIGHAFNFGRTTSYETNSFESVNSSNTKLEVTTTASIFTGFRITNEIKSRKFDLLAATEGLKKAKENLELQVTAYYLEVLLKKEIYEMYQEQAKLTSKQVERTRILVESGKVALSQLYDIKAQLAEDNLNITIAKNDLENSLLVLAQALNLRSTEDFDIVVPEVDITTFLLDAQKIPDEVYQKALTIKPHIKEAKYMIESSKKSLKVAQAGYWPKLDFSMGYSTYLQRVYNYKNASFNDQFRNNGSEYIGFTLSIPLFNRFETRNNVRQARFNITNREYNLMNVKLALYKDIQQAYQDALNASAKYTSTSTAYEAAQESFKYAKDRYEVGKISVFEYNEAQTKLTTSKSNQLQSKYDYVFRCKILDFYQGNLIDI